MLQCVHLAVTGLPLKVLFYPCKAVEEEEAGEAVHTIKLHTVLVQEDGVKRHGERFVGATSDRRGRCSAVMRLQQGLSSQYPQPNITHGLEEATEPTEKRGRRFVLPEQGGSRRVLRLQWVESRALACYMLQKKLVLFSQSHHTLT